MIIRLPPGTHHTPPWIKRAKNMDEATQALLADVPGIDRNDPAILAALAVMRLEKPQAPGPSAEPPWLLKDLTETIASFLCPVDALALDASGSATRCVLVEEIVDGSVWSTAPRRS